jgi:hypothetical protein
VISTDNISVTVFAMMRIAGEIYLYIYSRDPNRGTCNSTGYINLLSDLLVENYVPGDRR